MIPVLLLYFLRLCLCQQEAVYLINYDSQVETCGEESDAFIDVSGIEMDRYNETLAYMEGYVEFLKEVGPNTMVEVVLEKENSGKYELLFTHEIWDFCDEVSLGPESDYHSHLKNIALPEQCPFEPGKYAITNMVISSEELPANSNTCGRYMASLSLYNIPDKDKKYEKELYFCVRLKVIVEME